MSNMMSVLTGDRTCVKRLPGGAGGAAVVIKAAVGNAGPPRCQNFPDDVRTIQRALNRFTPLNGGPVPKLVPDGICGPLTRSAILHFQEKWQLTPKNSKVADGIVDPEGPTIRQLREGSGPNINLPAEFMARIGRVTAVLTATRAALTLAKRFVQRSRTSAAPSVFPALDLVGKAEAAKVDRHFHINKTTDPLVRIGKVEGMFLDMLTAIGHVPQGVVIAADEPPSSAVGALMFTFMGGYHLRGIGDTFEGLPKGSIYLCPRARTLSQDGFTYCMLHELAHFVGPPAQGIDDFAYFHKAPQTYRNLSPDLTLRNADSYSQFAFDAIGKPDFDLTS